NKEIEGSCETGRTISVVYGEYLTGPGTATCANSTFSFIANVSGEAGERQLTLTQTDVAGNSTQVTRKFQRAEPVGAKIYASRANSCIITTNQTGYCWGEAKQGQVGNGLSTIDQLAPVPLLGVG